MPAQYLPAPAAPRPRTLIDIIYETAANHPHAAAIDDGTVVLTYRELIADIEATVGWLAARGIGRGDRIGIRMPSGSYAVYAAILATLATGAAYVPVDADDSDERAEWVFTEAGVVAVITEAGLLRGPGSSRGWRATAPLARDDAWIMFTSGSTPARDGVAVTHRSAAAFVDAEADVFLRDNPIGPGDRVLAGRSVAFDASCEEMWLAWRHGACLVPAPRSLVRSPTDLGAWLITRGLTVVSTRPSVVAQWPAEALEAVRLLIFGGEVCPPALAAGLAGDPLRAGLEVWSTYGPTEATVVACAARLDGSGPLRIGSPLPGCELAAVDPDGNPVGYGEVGQLVIGGVGLARYLDKDRDAEKYAPLPALGWARAYRTRELVRRQPDGLYLYGREEDHVDAVEADDHDPAELAGTTAWLAGLWRDVLGTAVDGAAADFFALGGGSLAAAHVIAKVRHRYPQATVADLYDHPRLGSLAEFLNHLAPSHQAAERVVRPTSRLAQATQIALSVPLATLAALPWVTWLALGNNVARAANLVPWTVAVNWWLVAAAFVVFVTPLGRMGLAALCAQMLLSNVRPGTYRRGGSVHLRVWAAERVAGASGARKLAGTPWLVYYARALGAHIGKDVDLRSLPPVTGLLTIGRGSAIEPAVDLCGYWVDGDTFRVGELRIGEDARVGARTVLAPGAVVGDNAEVAAGSAVFDRVGNGQYWAGSPAVRSTKNGRPWPGERPPRRRRWTPVYGLAALLIEVLPVMAVAGGLAVLTPAVRHTHRLSEAILPTLQWVPAATLVALGAYALLTVIAVRALSIGLREGYHPVRSRVGFQLWATDRLMDAARTHLFPLYAGMLTPVWLRLLGATVGRGAQIPAAALIPKFTVVEEDAILADDTRLGPYELGGGWIYAVKTTVGRRASLGDGAIVPPGRRVPDDALVAALAVAPLKAGPGSSWVGSPPMRLRRSAAVNTSSVPARFRLMRVGLEACRLVPVLVSAVIGLAVLGGLQALARVFGFCSAALCGGVVLLTAGAIAGCVSVAAKWLVLGRVTPAERPIWSSFVARTRLCDAFVEVVAGPWFARAAGGTAALNLWLRGMGAHVGRGAWCETRRLGQPDLVRLTEGAAVNRGCVLQTQLLHDRTMRTDAVVLGRGATLGPHSVTLPGVRVGYGATVGPASLVVRGDKVPGSTRWQGNPIKLHPA